MLKPVSNAYFFFQSECVLYIFGPKSKNAKYALYTIIFTIQKIRHAEIGDFDSSHFGQQTIAGSQVSVNN